MSERHLTIWGRKPPPSRPRGTRKGEVAGLEIGGLSPSVSPSAPATWEALLASLPVSGLNFCEMKVRTLPASKFSDSAR